MPKRDSEKSSKTDRDEVEELEVRTLERLLATRPQPKTKKDDDAAPKKRGRPPKPEDN